MEAIIIAATRVIERDGLERLTTTRIAEIAGVSIGSLYQYFDSREAILGAIIDRQLDAMLVSFRQIVDALAGLPLEATIRGVLFGLLDASREHERLHGPLYEEMSAARRTDCHARTLDAYAWRWYRVGAPDNVLDRSDLSGGRDGAPTARDPGKS